MSLKTHRSISHDVLKGVAIILMVMLHARSPEWSRHFSGLFHMPVWSLGVVLKESWMVLAMGSGGTEMGGAFWFLRALFFASLSYCGVSLILQFVKCPVVWGQSAVALLAILLILHLFVFKLLNALLVYLKGDPAFRIADFPVTYCGGAWFVAYTCVGVAVPILFGSFYDQIWNCALKRIGRRINLCTT